MDADGDTLTGFLAHLELEHAGRPAIIDPAGASRTYAEFRAQVRAIASRLGPRQRTERIAIVMPNGPQMSAALLAVASVCVSVPFNSAYTEAELEEYFTQARIGSLLVTSERSAAARAVAARLGIEIMEFGEGTPPEVSTGPLPEDIAIILLTSGTTGRSKLVPLTHRNLTAGARNVAASISLSPDDRVLSMWEQYHVGGVVDLLLAPLAAGSSIISAGGFSADRALELLASHRPTWFQGVPTTIRELYHRARERRPNWHDSSLRFLRSVASALPPEWMHDLESYFNVPVIQTFGMTEAAPLITSTRLPPALRKPNSTGVPCGTTIAVIDSEGRELPAGDTGEVAVRGANVFSGYLEEPEVNAASFRQGWFLTGDLGRLDPDGELFLVGRTKDMINRGGEKISPREVEDALLTHPSIEEAAVFAVSHPTLGEDLGAAVVFRRGEVATTVDIKAFVSSRLAPFKVPQRYIVLPELPKSSVGKVQRSQVAALYLQSLKQTHRIAPSNGLEAALAKIWAEDLDLEPDAVGVEDLFVELGGDSLSSLRILLAAENLLGTKIPEDASEHFHTVRSMAEYLIERGSAKEPPFHGKVVDIDAAVLMARRRLETYPLDPRMLAATLLPRDFRVARHAAENVATPTELKAMLDESWLRPGYAIRHPLLTLELARARRSVGKRLMNSLSRATNSGEWVRQPIASSADLFSSSAVPTSQKTLIVGFCGRAMRLTAPTYTILCALDPRRCDLLMLRDLSRQHYRFGLAGLGPTLEAAARWLDDYARSKGYARTIALGSSAGGIPAVCTALLNRWPRVLAAGADQPSRHSHLLELLRVCASLPNTDTDVRLAYSSQLQRDSIGAKQIRDFIPMALLVPDKRFKEHSLLDKLQARGELWNFFEQHLMG
jgi:acyl carrier protein